MTYRNAWGRTWDRIQSLEPDVQELAVAYVLTSADQGLPVRITQARRSSLIQAAYYAQGREDRDAVNRFRIRAGLPPLGAAERNRIVTNAPPGHSWHEFGRAFDIVPMTRAARLVPEWASPWWKTLGAIGRDLGLEWGGDWRKPDRPHFQFPNGRTLADLRKEQGLA